jgi:predicted transglutaminase-like protease
MLHTVLKCLNKITVLQEIFPQKFYVSNINSAYDLFHVLSNQDTWKKYNFSAVCKLLLELCTDYSRNVGSTEKEGCVRT